MASKRSPACGVHCSGDCACAAGNWCDVCQSGACALGSGSPRRPSTAPECHGVRPCVGEWQTDVCCGREHVVGGVDGVPVLCPVQRKRARCNCIRRLRCSNSSCSSRSSKSRSSAANTSSWFSGGVVVVSPDKREESSLSLSSPCIDSLCGKNHII